MMKTDRNYSRKSITDNTIYPVDQLIRFTKNKEGQISFDPNKNKPGRGAYCLNDDTQIEILFKKKLLNKAYRQNIDLEIYEQLRNEVNIWRKNQIEDNQI